MSRTTTPCLGRRAPQLRAILRSLAPRVRQGDVVEVREAAPRVEPEVRDDEAPGALVLHRAGRPRQRLSPNDQPKRYMKCK